MIKNNTGLIRKNFMAGGAFFIILVLGLFLVNSYAQTDDVSIVIDVDKDLCNPGESAKAFLSLTNTGYSVYGDFYLVLIDPEQNIFFYPTWTTDISVMKVNIQDSFTLPPTLFAEFSNPDNNLPIQLPGEYTFAAGLAHPDSLDFISIGTSLVMINGAPEAPYPPTGLSKGWVEIPYTFRTLSLDQVNDSVSIRFDWGDGSPESEWSEFVPAGETVAMVHAYDTANDYYVRAQAIDSFGIESAWSNSTKITIIDNYSPKMPSVEGPTEGQIYKEYFFLLSAEDKDGDNVSFIVDWGDGDTTDWTAPVASGENLAVSHIWGESNIFNITVNVMDDKGSEASFPAVHTITIKPNRAPYFTMSPSGPPNGQRNVSYGFSVIAEDFDGDDVRYKFEWGDGDESVWSEYMKSGTEYTAFHAFDRFSEFHIRAFAEDTSGNLSIPSGEHIIEISTNRLPHFNKEKPTAQTADGQTGINYWFSIVPIDPEREDMQVKFVWGDGEETEWSAQQANGSTFQSSHAFHEAGHFNVYALAKDSDGIQSLPSNPFLMKIMGDGNEPPVFYGPPYTELETAYVGVPVTFYTSAFDPEDELIQYKFYWGDGEASDWTAPLKSDVPVWKLHTYYDVSTYWIHAYAKDEKGNETRSPDFELEVEAE